MLCLATSTAGFRACVLQWILARLRVFGSKRRKFEIGTLTVWPLANEAKQQVSSGIGDAWGGLVAKHFMVTVEDKSKHHS